MTVVQKMSRDMTLTRSYSHPKLLYAAAPLPHLYSESHENNKENCDQEQR